MKNKYTDLCEQFDTNALRGEDDPQLTLRMRLCLEELSCAGTYSRKQLEAALDSDDMLTEASAAIRRSRCLHYHDDYHARAALAVIKARLLDLSATEETKT